MYLVCFFFPSKKCTVSTYKKILGERKFTNFSLVFLPADTNTTAFDFDKNVFSPRFHGKNIHVKISLVLIFFFFFFFFLLSKKKFLTSHWEDAENYTFCGYGTIDRGIAVVIGDIFVENCTVPSLHLAESFFKGK